ncbi:MAG: PAS domain S-box protein [Phycisphaerales bacterium]
MADLLERATDFVARVDKDGRVLQVNKGGQSMLGLVPGAEASGHLTTYLPPWAAELTRTKALPTAAREGMWFGESALVGRRGREIPVSQVVLAHHTPDGTLEHFSIVARDNSERKRAEQALSDSERRYRQLVQCLPAAVYTCDAEGRITLYNDAAVALWGRTPDLETDRWCGSLRIFRVDGSPLPLDQCPMAIAVRDARPVRKEEIVIERPDGSRSNVLPHPEPLLDAQGTVVGAINMLVDITDRKNAERALRERESRLQAMFRQAAVGIALMGLSGRLLEVNGRFMQILGRSADELTRMSCQDLNHPEDSAPSNELLAQVARSERGEFAIEKRYVRGDGSPVWVNVTISPLLDERGSVQRMIAIVEDISARKLAEQEIQRHREHLEQLVRERTSELETSHERLRAADRLASIGTLAAGLGHDMGNLLLPVSMRIDALEHMDLPATAQEDVSAIAQACEYLKRLSRGLRLFSLSPEHAQASGEHTDLNSWWADVSPFLRNALPRGVTFEGSMPTKGPLVAMSPHRLTQAIYNLVQNAGDALKSRGHGRVAISASVADDAGSVVVEVSDDGPGMSAEVVRRCMEPFFTTKTRGISTGLGLALVRGSVVNAGGSTDIRSQPGKGTTIRLTLPAKPQPLGGANSHLQETEEAACVDLSDVRMRAYACSLLKNLGVTTAPGPWSPRIQTPLLVIDEPGDRARELTEFLVADAGRRAVVFGGEVPASVASQVIVLDRKPPALDVRTALQAAALSLRQADSEPGK